MKRINTLAVMLSLFALMNAQNIVQNHYDDNPTALTEDGETQEELNRFRTGGFSLEYMGVEDAWGLNTRGNCWGFELGFSMIHGKENDYISSNTQTRIDLGYAPRYWFNKTFFIEGTIGVGYYWSSVRLTNTSSYWHSTSYGGYYATSYDYQDIKDDDFYMTISPRIGVKCFKLWDLDWAIVAGYRWDFYEFKTKKENTLDYFTVGLTIVW